ncbi:MAG: DUF308 domain-containing protein [Alphaproteobacteria bacterium]|jgi:uncharacterized membrane protein HdeD (DUF308 family)
MKTRSVAPMKIAKIGYIVVSVLFCMAGILFIALPEISAKIVGIEIGIAAIVFGIVKLIGYFSKDLYRLAFQFDLEFGIMMVVLGTIVLFHPKNVMAFIAAAFGIAILFDGLFKIRIALDSKRFGIKDWWLILSLAIIAGIIGVALIFDSAFGAGVLTILIGVSFLSEGILNLYTVIRTVLIVKNQVPDFVETDTIEFFEKDR